MDVVSPPVTLAEIRLIPDEGVWHDRDLRILGLEVGEFPDASELAAARSRLMAQPGVRDVSLLHVGSELKVTVQRTPTWSGSAQVLPPITPLGLTLLHDHQPLGVFQTYYRFQGGHAWDVQPSYPDVPGAQYPHLLVSGEMGAWFSGELKGGLALSGVLPTDRPVSWIQTVGPVLRYEGTDVPGSPRNGIRWRWQSKMGSSSSGRIGDFWVHQGDWGRYAPWGDSTFLTTVSLGFGRGDVPWYQQFQAGVGWPFRGLPFRRFVGDQLLVCGVELRRPLVSLPFSPGWPPIGLTGAIFGNGGRVWSRSSSPAFPGDWRLAGGGYLGLSMGSWHVGRVEAALSSEGGWLGLVNGWPMD